MDLMKRFLLIVLLAAFAPYPALAQKDNTGMLVKDMGNPVILRYEPPPEPQIQPVKFLKKDPPLNLRERVDRLLHGIKAAVPPEYDHYGYELRRYMAHISGPSVFNNPERIKEELSNIKKADIILKYWRQEIMRENTEIVKLIDEQNAPTNTRTSFKYNSGTAMAFLSECHTWIQKNRELLEFLLANQGNFVYADGRFEFPSMADRDTFAAIFMAAIQSRSYVNEYVPFAGMVY
ncbi:MAG: hypothetical protein DYH13_06855 [Alphaproteobacteria bacterium PRO2]|nr:hypothetical protein [Alphaproteobacteria bacterium PRO2]